MILITCTETLFPNKVSYRELVGVGVALQHSYVGDTVQLITEERVVPLNFSHGASMTPVLAFTCQAYR